MQVLPYRCVGWNRSGVGSVIAAHDARIVPFSLSSAVDRQFRYLRHRDDNSSDEEHGDDGGGDEEGAAMQPGWALWLRGPLPIPVLPPVRRLIRSIRPTTAVSHRTTPTRAIIHSHQYGTRQRVDIAPSTSRDRLLSTTGSAQRPLWFGS